LLLVLTRPRPALSLLRWGPGPQPVTTRLYPVTAHELRLVFAKVIASEPRVSLAEANDAALTDRYIQRSVHLGFPDTIVVRFLDRADGRSTIAGRLAEPASTVSRIIAGCCHTPNALKTRALRR